LRIDSGALVLWLLALVSLANGLWMVADPAGWYQGIPAAVPDTGPLNLHFVRDIGSVYLTMAAALFWGGARATDRVPLLAMVLLFHLLHAGAHAVDTVAGRLPASHWAIDFPGVYFPTIVLAVVLARLARRSLAQP
jgi:hypothetical protein